MENPTWPKFGLKDPKMGQKESFLDFFSLYKFHDSFLLRKMLKKEIQRLVRSSQISLDRIEFARTAYGVSEV